MLSHVDKVIKLDYMKMEKSWWMNTVPHVFHNVKLWDIKIQLRYPVWFNVLLENYQTSSGTNSAKGGQFVQLVKTW